MPVKSSRFARTAYANRAASLADELDDWWSIYKTRVERDYAFVWDDRQAAVFEDRAAALEYLVTQLRGIAVQILALR